jgi:DNA polymerase elongation subunit (family B)
MTKPFHTNVYRHKQTLVFRGRDEYGKRVEHKERFQPTIFLHPTSPEVQDLVSDGWKSITGHPRVPFQPGSMWDTKQFVEEYTQVADNAHTPPEGTEKHEHAFLGKYYGRQDADWNPEHIDICYLDIETTCEQGFPDVKNPVEELLCLTLVTNNEKAVLACRPFEKIDGYKCIECASERELLERVCHFVQQIDPDILTGWNSKFFDIPYLVARIERVLGE